MKEVLIRQCQAFDVERLLLLEQECFSDAWTEKQIQSEFSRIGFLGLVAEYDDEIIGYAFAVSLFEDADLERIAVSQAYRGEGIGGKLLDALLLGVKGLGAERMLLEVRASNEKAKRLYESRGFSPFHIRKGYYINGEDAVEMEKIL